MTVDIRIRTLAIAFVLIVVSIAGFIGYRLYPRATHYPSSDYTLPHDVFDSTTVGQIWRYLYQYNMVGTPRNYMVYMLTGGLGVANPEISGFGGQLISLTDSGTGTTYELMETTPYRQVQSNWIKEETKLGQVYYKLNAPSQATQYFFNIGQTGFQLVIRTSKPENFPQLPAALFSHLIPVGNPVTQG